MQVTLTQNWESASSCCFLLQKEHSGCQQSQQSQNGCRNLSKGIGMVTRQAKQRLVEVMNIQNQTTSFKHSIKFTSGCETKPQTQRQECSDYEQITKNTQNKAEQTDIS